MNVKDLKKFEQNIGYSFKDIEHLKIALTHKSYIDEDPTSKTNQRYEFIGDTILDFDLSIFLFNNSFSILLENNPLPPNSDSLLSFTKSPFVVIGLIIISSSFRLVFLIILSLAI